MRLSFKDNLFFYTNYGEYRREGGISKIEVQVNFYKNNKNLVIYKNGENLILRKNFKKNFKFIKKKKTKIKLYIDKK